MQIRQLARWESKNTCPLPLSHTQYRAMLGLDPLHCPSVHDAQRSTIGPYIVSREIGRGGMGVVYLARDSRLDRDVAIKALPEHVAADAERLSRFEREAKTLAQINHPNIAGIHGLEEQDGSRFLILEYVEGETLAERLDGGALSVDDALEFGAQIAAGMEAAHEAGIIHRDLKPANIKITPEGNVKVLDFGLARADESASSSSISENPTLTTPFQHTPTMPGAVLGTAPYMSPEQARGRKVDKRTDIWSFGVVLYEMLSGIGPFHGETATDSIGAILHKDVDLAQLPPATPKMVRHVIERCLARDKNERYRDIGDVRLELQRADKDDAPPPTPKSSRALLAIVSAALVVALVALGAMVVMNQPAPPPPLTPIHVSLEPPNDARILFSGDLAGPPVVSPDGTQIAFCAALEGKMRSLWVRDLGKSDPRELSSTDGALFPFWSPDGREIGFFTVDSLLRFDLTSDTVQRICDVAQARGGTWADDGSIIFSHNFQGGLLRVDTNGGEPTELTTLDETQHTSHRWPFAIPGTNKFLFLAVSARSNEQENNAIYVGTLEDTPPKKIIACDYRAEFINDRLLYVRDSVLLASKVNLDDATITDRPIVIAKDLAPDLSTWHGQFSASSSGVLVFSRTSDSNSTAGRTAPSSLAAEGDRISHYTHAGRVATTYAAGMPMLSLALSPDGRTLAMSVLAVDGALDIWLHPTAWIPERNVRGASKLQKDSFLTLEPQRLTFLSGAEVEPVWSPKSDEVMFWWEGDATHPRGIYRKRIGGGTEVLVRDNQGEDDYPVDWTRDGKYLVFVTGGALLNEKNDIRALSLEDGTEMALVEAPGPDYDSKVSPDGRWLAYTSRESGKNDVYVIPFAPNWPEDKRAQKWRVSPDGGVVPRWSREGDELYYISDVGSLVAVGVNAEDESFSFTPPRELFPAPWDTGRTYDPTPDAKDGTNGFMFLDSDEGNDAPISMILNWQALLAQNQDK